MVTCDELIDVGVRALQDVWMDSGDGPSNRELAAAVIDAVEPLIRAAEREQFDRAHRRTAQWAREKALADLRAKVEALPHAIVCDSHRFGPKNEYLPCDCWHAKVLALFDGDGR